LSIVPPRDALETARTFAGAWSKSKDDRGASKQKAGQPAVPLYYVDLNAISPGSANEINTLFELSAPEIRFVDGGIIGGPPSLKDKEKGQWFKPGVVCSGPDSIEDAELGGKQLADVLNIRHVGPAIGSGSGLKMCFASLHKGATALAIEAYTAAHTLGVLPQLRTHLQEYSPGVHKQAENGITRMPPKAYRWVAEMQEIANTFNEVGFGKEMFEGARDVYELVADDTELGKEKTEERDRGQTPEDVALLIAEGLKRRKQKTD
jgi:3-hydroxyisobutyrate dehydrogenase-like beta-hydroxyacid dehydrogenase